MTGVKKLSQVRAELEAALGSGPAGRGEVAESLRRFLAAGSGEPVPPSKPTQPPTRPKRQPAAKSGR